MSTVQQAWSNMLNRSQAFSSNPKYPRPDRSRTGANPQTFVSEDPYPSAYVQFASSGFFEDRCPRARKRRLKITEESAVSDTRKRSSAKDHLMRQSQKKIPAPQGSHKSVMQTLAPNKDNKDSPTAIEETKCPSKPSEPAFIDKLSKKVRIQPHKGPKSFLKSKVSQCESKKVAVINIRRGASTAQLHEKVFNAIGMSQKTQIALTCKNTVLSSSQTIILGNLAHSESEMAILRDKLKNSYSEETENDNRKEPDQTASNNSRATLPTITSDNQAFRDSSSHQGAKNKSSRPRAPREPHISQ